MILKYKKLVQSSSSFVTLGSSSTNMFAYKVMVHKVKMIVASNRFRVELQDLNAADRAWIEDSMVHVDVQEPSFL